MSSVCPACSLSHNNCQVPASRGAYCDYDVCYAAVKKASELLKDAKDQMEFRSRHREYMNKHCRESTEARKAKPSREDYPIISKPLLFYRNTAADSDDWRRRND
jgi:hypothetical protein